MWTSLVGEADLPPRLPLPPVVCDEQVAEAPRTLLHGSPVLPVSSLAAMVLRRDTSADGLQATMAAPQARRILPVSE